MDIETQFENLERTPLWEETLYAGRRLASIAAAIDPACLPGSYLRGKTAVRDTVIGETGCSMVEAERVVDAMEERGQIAFSHNRRGVLSDPRWRMQR